MTEKTKWPRNDALLLASLLKAVLGQFCERIEIAGSLRRGKAEVGDIELLMIPRIGTEPDGLFEQKSVDLADACLNNMLAQGELQKRPSKIGVFTWGPKNKLAIHTETGIPVDFFTTTAENWFVSLVVRTGSKETNLRLTTGAQKLARSLNAYGSGVTFSDGTTEAATSEQDVFRLCGVPYLEPRQR